MSRACARDIHHLADKIKHANLTGTAMLILSSFGPMQQVAVQTVRLALPFIRDKKNFLRTLSIFESKSKTSFLLALLKKGTAAK